MVHILRLGHFIIIVTDLTNLTYMLTPTQNIMNVALQISFAKPYNDSSSEDKNEQSRKEI